MDLTNNLLFAFGWKKTYAADLTKLEVNKITWENYKTTMSQQKELRGMCFSYWKFMGDKTYAFTKSYGRETNIYFKKLTDAMYKKTTNYKLENKTGTTTNFVSISNSIEQPTSKLYLFRGNRLEWAAYPPNNTSTLIEEFSGGQEGYHMYTKDEGGKDVLYFCNKRGFVRYEPTSSASVKYSYLIDFVDRDWGASPDHMQACKMLEHPKRYYNQKGDRAYIYEEYDDNGTKKWRIRVKRRRFGFFYKHLRASEIPSTNNFLLYGRHSMFIVSSDDLSIVHTFFRGYDGGDLAGNMQYMFLNGFG